MTVPSSPAPTIDDDAALLERLRNGDRDAYGVLWSRHCGVARAMARSITRSHDPDDLVSEAFARILGAIRRGAGPRENFIGYLHVTIRAIAASWSRTVAPIDESQLLGTTLADLVIGERHDDEILLIREVFRTLPDRSRNVLWLTVIEGRSPRETGEALSISPGAAAVLAHRARKALRERWEALTLVAA